MDSLWQRFRHSLGHWLGARAEEHAQVAPPGPLPAGPRPVANDGEAYGVRIEPVQAGEGEWYWQVTGVHHLTPSENRGKALLYLEVLEPAGSEEAGWEDRRVAGARLRVSYAGGMETADMAEATGPAGVPFKLTREYVYAVEVAAAVDAALPSERVTGLHTNHPDEGRGNKVFRHSFHVTFTRVQAPIIHFFESQVSGTLGNAANRVAVLWRDGEMVGRQHIGEDGSFQFTGLGEGSYQLGVQDTRWRSADLALDGKNQVTVNQVLADSVIAGRVRNGAGQTVRLLWDGVEVSRQEVAGDDSYRFEGLGAGSYQVAVEGLPLATGVLPLDGVQGVSVDLAAPPKEKVLGHYVLFGPAEQPLTQANLLLAQDFLLVFRPSFGFNPAEASQARLVTVIADGEGVPEDVEAGLVTGGTLVQRVQGSTAEVSKALALRIAAGQPFAVS